MKLHVAIIYSAKAKNLISGQSPAPSCNSLFLKIDEALKWAEQLREKYADFEIKEFPTLLLECDTGFVIFTQGHYGLIRKICNALHESTKLADLATINPALGHIFSIAMILQEHDLTSFTICERKTNFLDRYSLPTNDLRSAIAWSLKENSEDVSELLEITSSSNLDMASGSKAQTSPAAAQSSVDSSTVLLNLNEHIEIQQADIARRTIISPLHWSDEDIIPRRSPLQNLSFDTIREQLTLARVGQGLFRKRLEEIEKFCRLTGLRITKHLRASHIKPWRICDDDERLDGNNGLLLSPHVDHLFDQGYLTFGADGKIEFSKLLDVEVIHSWNLDRNLAKRPLNKKQLFYMEYHWNNIFRRDK